MRMAIGLAAILVTLGVIVWIMSEVTLPATKQALDVREQVTPKVEQIAGQTAQGVRAADTIELDAQESGGRLTGIVVTSVAAGGAMEQFFGLRKGDIITEIGPLPVRDMASVDEAKDYLTAEYQRSGQITITRDGTEMKLPSAAGPTPGEPAAPAGGDSLQKQLEAIQGAPR